MPLRAEHDAVGTAAELSKGATGSYDGDGKRVMKNPGKLYWYNTAGNVIVETDLSGNMLYHHYYFAGMRYARREPASGEYWFDHYGLDMLGNARFVYGLQGAWDLSDYYPFGGERVLGGYDQVGQPWKFTGKERDSESGLDNFEARYDSSSLGRFMSPDPGNTSGLLRKEDPQSWNAYSYVRNNPVDLTDEGGDTYQLCTHGRRVQSALDETHPLQCTDVSDQQFSQLQQDPGAGLSLRNGDIYANGEKVGSYNQTDVDLSPLAQGVFSQLNQMPIERFVYTVAGAGALIGATGGAACYYLCPEGTGALTLGEIRPGPGASKAARLVAQGGKKALQRGISSLTRKIAEHEAKIQAGKAAGEFTSSMEAEVANWKMVVRAMQNILRTMP